MTNTRARIIQIISVFIVHVITLYILQRTLSGFHVDTFQALVIVTIALGIAQSVFWWVFIRFFAWLPVWLYPIMTFFLNGFFVLIIGNLVNGITIESVGTGIWIT